MTTHEEMMREFENWERASLHDLKKNLVKWCQRNSTALLVSGVLLTTIGLTGMMGLW